MKYPLLLIRSLSAGAACVCLSGCLNLKPAQVTARYFVLSPIPVAAAQRPPVPAVGVGQVKLPSYLFKDSLAVRKGANEIEYMETASWAEHLQGGFQRVLAANLGALLPARQVRISAWHRKDVAMEVHVTVEQFDVDAGGSGVLVAWWRVLSPGGENVLKAGHFRSSCQGPPPRENPQGATATLSQLVGSLSQQLAEGMRTISDGEPTKR